jgi:ribonuclease HI
MSDTSTWTINTDGGARGNPGPAAYAYVIKRPGEADIEAKSFLGHTTNNIAEYTGLVKALEHACELGGRKLLVLSDSELMVKQMNGEYRVKNEGLQPLFQQASQLRKQFDSVAIRHVRREQNQQADALCNEALDGQGHPKTSTKPQPAAIRAPSRTEALEIMKQSVLRWAEGGDPMEPDPAEVLRQLWELFQAGAKVAD